MATALTAKQEAFACAYLALGNASAAYRAAYDCGNSSDASVHRNAHAVLQNTKVASRLAELRAPVVAKARYDYEQAMLEAEEARQLALKCENPGAMVAAATLRAKLSGLMVEDRKNERDPFDSLTTAELQAIAASAPSTTH